MHSTGHINHYGVNYTRLKSKAKVNRAQVLCRIKRLHLKILDETSSILFEGKHFPSEPLFSSEVEERSKYESGYSGDAPSSSDSKSRSNSNSPLYRSCAVIPNSAALDGAKHGIDIGNPISFSLLTMYSRQYPSLKILRHAYFILVTCVINSNLLRFFCDLNFNAFFLLGCVVLDGILGWGWGLGIWDACNEIGQNA